MTPFLNLKRTFWKTKFRINWISQGDANTRFFYISTLNRRRKNRICSIENEVGQVLCTKMDIASHVHSYFYSLFTTSLLHSQLIEDDYSINSPSISSEDSLRLYIPLRDSEILTVIKSFNPLKAPGPDGLHPIFYQKYRDLVGSKTSAFCKEAFSSNLMPESINQTLLVLIPKCPDPTSQKLQTRWTV